MESTYFQGKQKEDVVKEYQKKVSKLVTKVINGNISLNITNLSFDTYSHWFLTFSVLIIPVNTSVDTYIELINQAFDLFFDILNEKKKNRNHDLSQYIQTEREYQKYLAQFLLSQPKNTDQDFFSKILNRIYSEENPGHYAIDYVKDIIENIILEEDRQLSPRFWDIWEVLEEKIRLANFPLFIDKLFLSIPWWNSDAEDWKPLHNKELYLRKLIIELGHKDIKSAIRLVSGIGTVVLLPEGIIWLKTAIGKITEPNKELIDPDTMFYCERLIRRAYRHNSKGIKTDKGLRSSFLFLLDMLINLGSSVAFIIRERLISLYL